MSDAYTLGIEEEYFLADEKTCESPNPERADRFHKAASKSVKPAEHELLKGQVEVATKPGTCLDEMRADLAGWRKDLSAIAADHKLMLSAAGGHPCGRTEQQHTSSTPRYRRLTDELKDVAPRAMLCAMHVHVEVPDPDARIDLINRLLPFLPVLLALSTSSPFWERRDSGLKCSRLSAFAQWPRTGLPILFAGKDDYDRYTRRLETAGFISDPSMIWWLIRPSTHYPTIEMRICDSCTRLDDAIAIAALFRSLVRAVVRRPDVNAGIGSVEYGLTQANLWQVQQHGTEAELADLHADRTSNFADNLMAALALTGEDIEALGVARLVERTKDIAASGTSADRQLEHFRNALQKDTPGDEALRHVTKLLAAETLDL